jgi:hypothetical protein
LYASTLIATWQRLISLNISWDFAGLGEGIGKRGMLTVVVLFACDRRVIDIFLSLITSKPRFTNPTEMSSAGVENGRCRITAYTGLWDVG